ncbi:hypothetical protein BD289DRAFT_484205 [Coniella lustricola]|uniref:COP9 signalosome complex subunit 3 N-terminal helical repeats domain-containing protein n=1 Tax=Coniella lustricola TaxID=2025994 RepID=A0A2T3A2U6_9PEZI|nr:hypothetical protein BD289DRAFT_484205 [Coniella lustricola]
MEEATSILLGFPPEADISNDDFYDQAVNIHIKQVEHLLSAKKTTVSGEDAVKILKLLDPAVHSISYLAILDSLSTYDGLSHEDRGRALIDFFLNFDPRQIRYVGSMFSLGLNRISTDSFPLPHDVKVSLIAGAILKIDPTGSMLTSHHLALVNLAYETDTAEYAFDVLDKQIVYFPGMSRNQGDKYKCDMSLPPTDYITPETGLTTRLDIQPTLEYDLLSGLLYCSRAQWAKACAAFERVITHPTRDGGVSTIMTDAYNKWLLVNLLVNGHTPEMPTHIGTAAKKAYETLSKPYAAVASHFDAMAALPLKEEVERQGETWSNDQNTGLVQQVLAAHQKWQIMDLRNVYSKVAIADIRQTTCSAETGDALPSDEEVEKLIQGMIVSGMLKGMIEKPADKPPYLTFLSESEELSESEYKHHIASAVQTLTELEAMYKTTNARLSTNPYWIKHLIREQKREKENAGQEPPTFDDQIEDEDLMSGVTTGRL